MTTLRSLALSISPVTLCLALAVLGVILPDVFRLADPYRSVVVGGGMALGLLVGDQLRQGIAELRKAAGRAG